MYMFRHTGYSTHVTAESNEITQQSKHSRGNAADESHSCDLLFTCLICDTSWNSSLLLNSNCLSSQALLKEVGEWRRQEEANNCLRRRFEESRQDLERVLKKAQSCLRETGDADDLLKKHTVRSTQLPSVINST